MEITDTSVTFWNVIMSSLQENKFELLMAWKMIKQIYDMLLNGQHSLNNILVQFL